MINELIDKYKLSSGEHNRVLESLKELLFKDKETKDNPSVMFVIGQPGCGKTTFIKSLNSSEYIIINSDNYRSFSKYSSEILEKYSTDYAKLTNFDAHLWGDELFSYAIQNGYSVLREKAPTDYSLLEVLKSISPNYDIIINVVVEGNLSSLIRTRERYEKEILKSDSAKLSNIESHNKCYEILPEFIKRCLSLGIKVNYIVYTDSEYKTVTVSDNYLDLLQKIRDESNKKTLLNYGDRMANIKENMIKRNAPNKQFDELTKVESLYYEITNQVNNKVLYDSDVI